RWATRRASSSSRCARTSGAGRRWSRRRTSGSSRRRQRARLEHLDALGRLHPRMRGTVPAEARHLEPLRVVERAETHRAHARQRLQSPEHLRAALRAELEAQPAVAFVGMVLVGGELAAELLHLLGLVIGADAERAAGAFLAHGAMAGGHAQRHSFGAVAQRAADTAAFMDLHFSLSRGQGATAASFWPLFA